MAKTSSDMSVATGSDLARGTLRLPDAIAISVSVLAPGMAMLLNVSGVAATSGGSTPLAFLPGGFSGVFYGIILGVTSYIGFETAADFGEETSNPRRYIPIAVIAGPVPGSRSSTDWCAGAWPGVSRISSPSNRVLSPSSSSCLAGVSRSSARIS